MEEAGQEAVQPGAPSIDPHDLDVVSMNSSAQVRARNAIFAIDDLMRANYDALRAQVMRTLNPVIIVQPDLAGGAYTLIRGSEQVTMRPVPPIFQIVKSVCHSPLGIFSVIAPYLNGASSTDWVPGLSAYRSTLATALERLGDAEIPVAAQHSCRQILQGGIAFIDGALRRDEFTIQAFEEFTRPLQPAIEANMILAARAQLRGVERLLRTWRQQLGEDEWKQLYAVVLVIWTTEANNQHYLLLREMMDPTAIHDHLIVLAMADDQENTISVALDNLARIVQDKLAAAMIFSDETGVNARLAESLADPEDLLAWGMEQVIQACPHSSAHRRPVVSRTTAT